LPLVSVVIPTFQRADVLPRALRSVLDQTMSDLEVVVVDDGSTDETQSLVQAFGDKRIRYFRHKRNRGGNVARNTGIHNASGEFVAFQDSDDEWLPLKLEKQLTAANSLPNRIGIVYCKSRRLDETGSKKVFGEPFCGRNLLHHNFIDTPTMVVHRECLRNECFDEGLPRRQDWELCLRLAQRYEFVFVNEVLVIKNTSPGSVTSNRTKLLEAYQLIFLKHHHLIRKSPEALAEFHYVIGSLLMQEGQLHDGRVHLFKSVRHWPLDARHWGKALASMSGTAIYNRIFKSKGSN